MPSHRILALPLLFAIGLGACGRDEAASNGPAAAAPDPPSGNNQSPALLPVPGAVPGAALEPANPPLAAPAPATAPDVASATLAAAKDQLLARAAAALARADYLEAERLLVRAAALDREDGRVQDARADLAQRRSAAAQAALTQAGLAIDRLDLLRASSLLAQAETLDPQLSGLDALGKRLAQARRYGHFQPGQRFADTLIDGGSGPAMVVIAHGRFIMGAGPGEVGARDNEGPARVVEFDRGFALAVHETTVAEFAAFVAATGYVSVAERLGRSSVYDDRGGAMVELRRAHWRFGFDGRTRAAADHPVLHLAFEDAKAYTNWLSARTGQRYRLPSEAEFEYALRAGQTAAWPWGAGRPPLSTLANLTGENDRSANGRRWGRPIAGLGDGYWGPAPVGSFPAEGFQTHDLIGNVSEWVEDCWHDSYHRAPADGRAWINPGCAERVVRGGSWASTLDQARSAFRLQVPADLSSARIGFRVARDL